MQKVCDIVYSIKKSTTELKRNIYYMRVHKHHIYVDKILSILYDRPYNEKIYEQFRNLNKILCEINWLSYQQSTFIFGLRTNHILTH